MNTINNIFESILIRGSSIIISLALVPLTIQYVNPTGYGAWLTISSLIAWFSFFDIGLGNGLRNKFAEAVAKGDHQLARSYISTTYALLIIIVSIAIILFVGINPFLNWSKILNTSPEISKELRLLALIVFVFFCIQFVLQLISTIIIANQKTAKASFLNLLGNLLSLIIIFILTKTTHGNLLYLGVALSLTPILVLLISSFWFYNRDYKCYAPSLKYIDFSHSKSLLSLGVKFFFLQIASLILYQSSNLIIAQAFGPLEVTQYNIAYKYFGVITMISNIIMAPLWSAYTEAYIKNDLEWIKSTIQKVIKVWALLTLCVLIMLFISPTLFQLWVGKSINVPISLSFSLSLYVIINTWCSIFSCFLNGVGKIKIQIYSGLLGALVNIPLAFFLCKFFGIAGVVLSTCLLGVTSAIWSPLQYYKIVTNKAKGIWNK